MIQCVPFWIAYAAATPSGVAISAAQIEAVSVVLLICVFAIFYAASRVVPLEKTLGAK